MSDCHYIAADLDDLERGYGWASVDDVEAYIAKIARFQQLYPEQD